MRAVDILGFAVAALIGLLTLTVEPWSKPWWAAVIIASIIVLLALGHMIFGARIDGLKQRSKMNTWGPWILIIGGPLAGVVWLYLSSSGVAPKSSHQPQTTQSYALPSENPKPVSISQLSNGALQKAAIEFAERMRTFEANAKLREPKRTPMKLLALVPPEEQQKAQQRAAEIWEQDTQRTNEYHTRITNEFRNSYLLRARELRAEIERRLAQSGRFPPYMKGTNPATEQFAITTLEHGHLSGIRPVSDAADYIETIAQLLAD